ncbi:MAG: hypothetical protein AAFU54_09465 [Chloroflexota bacterium]
MYRALRVLIPLITIWFVSILLVRVVATGTQQLQLSFVHQRSGSNWDIYLQDVRLGATANLTAGLFESNARNRLPTWSPDGGTVAFISDYRGDVHVYTYNVETETLTRMTDESFVYSSLSWSPDGSMLAVSATQATPAGVRVIDVATQETRLLMAPDLPVEYAVFSPVDNRIAYVRSEPDDRVASIYTIPADGSDSARLLTSANAPMRLNWSPDGRYLAFVERLTLNSVTSVVDVETGDETSIQSNVNGVMHGDWSPVSTQWMGSRDEQKLVLFQDVPVTVATDAIRSEDIVLRSHRPGTRISNPVWSPDGRWIALEVTDNVLVETEIFLLNPDTYRLRRMTTNTQYDWSPAWRLAQ